ncbi:uncharacterized protein [Ptychodera flava]|uniref:uncharacterized protein isoform X3 n=1 Tax=Ptychodera flava TaxID=63121 RepID=UPI00396A87EA
MSLHWKEREYFPLLMLRDTGEAHAALEYFVDDLHKDKARTVNSFISHSGSEDFLWGLVRLLSAKNSRVAGNSAYILGTLAESEMGQSRVLSLIKDSDAQRILDDLTEMLAFDDPESVMNAAGTMGTLAESAEGREWILHHACLHKTILQITNLLNSDNMWTASNAALVLARLTISEDGSNSLLNHGQSPEILSKLVLSLGLDDAGRGMNAAFAIGRLCDMETGRARLLQLNESQKMLSSLCTMLGSEDMGCSKNACFAISCLAGSDAGHNRLLDHSSSEPMLHTLSKLLDSEDTETGWFAAMTLRTLASKRKGCLRLRDHKQVLKGLQEAETKPKIGEDLKEEVLMTLELLKKLEKPEPPRIKVLDSFSVSAEWDQVQLKSGLEVSFKLFEGNRCVYDGQECNCVVADLKPDKQYSFKVQCCTDGDSSPFSDVTVVTTEEWIPEPPTDLRVLGVTTTQVKICWLPPDSTNGTIRNYVVYNGKTPIDTTSELSSIVSGLSPGTTYEIQVCAVNSKGKGQKAVLPVTTTELASLVKSSPLSEIKDKTKSSQGQHAPEKPSLTVRGRSEIFVSWDHPELPLGRLHRFELTQNGKVIYSGTDTSFTARRLKQDTEYVFTVIAVTSEGRCESDPAKKKTSKDEYGGISSTAPLFASAPIRQESDRQPKSSKKRSKQPQIPVESQSSATFGKERDPRERESSSKSKPKTPTGNRRPNVQLGSSCKVFWPRQSHGQIQPPGQSTAPISCYNFSDHVSVQQLQSGQSRPSSQTAEVNGEFPRRLSSTLRKDSYTANREDGGTETWPSFPMYEEALQYDQVYEAYARSGKVAEAKGQGKGRESLPERSPVMESSAENVDIPSTRVPENEQNVVPNSEHEQYDSNGKYGVGREQTGSARSRQTQNVALDQNVSIDSAEEESVSRTPIVLTNDDEQRVLRGIDHRVDSDERTTDQEVDGSSPKTSRHTPRRRPKSGRKKSSDKLVDRKKGLPVASMREGPKDVTKLVTMSKKLPQQGSDSESVKNVDRGELQRRNSMKERKELMRQTSQNDMKHAQVQGRSSENLSESGRLTSSRSDRNSSKSPKRFEDGAVTPRRYLDSSAASSYPVYEEELYRIEDKGHLTQSLPPEYDVQLTSSLQPLQEPLAWQHETRFQESDVSKSLSALKRSYQKSPKIGLNRHIATDHNLPIKSSSLDPPSFYQRASAFINSHRPITKKALAKLPVQFTPGQMQSAHNLQYSPEFPSSRQAMTNKSQFIPMQYRTQPLNMPGAPLHRGNTMANLYDKSAYVRKLEELSRISSSHKVEVCHTCGQGQETSPHQHQPSNQDSSKPAMRYTHMKSTKPSVQLTPAKAKATTHTVTADS